MDTATKPSPPKRRRTQVLAFGSNLFGNCLPSTSDTLLHPTELPDVASVIAASWSQTLVRLNTGQLELRGLPCPLLDLDILDKASSFEILGRFDQFEAVLLDGSLSSLREDVECHIAPEGGIQSATMNALGEILILDSKNQLHLYPTLSAFSPSRSLPSTVAPPTHLVSGPSHHLILSSPHALTSLGDSRFYQRPPKGYFDGLDPIDCAGTAKGSVVVSEAGVYAIGDGEEDVRVEELEGEDEDGEALKGVVSGWGHYVVWSKHTVWVKGDNAYGQLGLGDTVSRATFTRVPWKDEGSRRITKVVAGMWTTFIEVEWED